MFRAVVNRRKRCTTDSIDSLIVKVWTVTLVLLLNTVLPGIFFGIAHNRGTLDVMNVLSKVAAKYPTQTSLLFLMPCHSTPLYRFFLHFYRPLFITGLLLPTDNIGVIEGTLNCDGIVRCYVLISAIWGQSLPHFLVAWLSGSQGGRRTGARLFSGVIDAILGETGLNQCTTRQMQSYRLVGKTIGSSSLFKLLTWVRYLYLPCISARQMVAGPTLIAVADTCASIRPSNYHRLCVLAMVEQPYTCLHKTEYDATLDITVCTAPRLLLGFTVYKEQYCFNLLSPHPRPTSYLDSRCRDFLMIHCDSRCRDIFLFHHN
uniref:Uncharacterized protein n=1 Tax=Timema tahoe TaxID=61484 RepID=A0A7R9NZ01_9NEOP|nr:unnamed protein product [Timema tahoe]